MSSRPLEGLRVLDLSRLLPGPYLTVVLADLGADVIKVESPSGGDWVRWVPPMVGGQSAQFIALNRGKRSIALNLKNPRGVEVLKRLAARADVLVESFRPGVMDRLGVGYETLRADNPGLVYAAVTGYGQSGPYRDRAGHDLNYIGLGGALGRTGQAGGPPQMPGFQLADVAGGSLFGAIGILSAVFAQQRTGEGRFVDISMTEGAMAFNVLTLGQHLVDGQPQRRGTDRLGGRAACYGVYETKDGGYMTVGALEPKFWSAFCQAVGRPDWKARHMGHDEAMKQEIAALFATKTRAEWEAVFAEADACVEPVLELEELPEHPQHAVRRMFFDLPLPGREEPIRQLRTPLVDPDHTAAIGPAPGLGAHTREVLLEADLTEADVDELIKARAVLVA